MFCHERIVARLLQHVSIIPEGMTGEDIIEGGPDLSALVSVNVGGYSRDNLGKRPCHPLAQLVWLSQSNFCPNHRPLILQGVRISRVHLFGFNGKCLGRTTRKVWVSCFFCKMFLFAQSQSFLPQEETYHLLPPQCFHIQ